ncbi:MAG: hypothetical protein HRT40_07920 [Campylobacteraceae bacterium]|nr:hypothetical protein [Campylobacteraceae bacterium]
MITTQDIIKMASYFTTISHTPGRLRVRVSMKIKKESSNLSIKDIETIPDKINGIISIKVKKLIGSVTILYDPSVFSSSLWEDLINGENLEEITTLINNLAKEVI